MLPLPHLTLRSQGVTTRTHVKILAKFDFCLLLNYKTNTCIYKTKTKTTACLGRSAFDVFRRSIIHIWTLAKLPNTQMDIECPFYSF